MNVSRHFRALALVSLVMASTASVAFAKDTDGDGIPDLVEEKIGSPVDVKQEFMLVATSTDRKYNADQAVRNAPDIVRFEACHLAGQRLLFKVTFARKPNFGVATFIIYADMDNHRSTGRRGKYHGGVDIMVGVSHSRLNVSCYNPAYNRANSRASGALDGTHLYVSLDAPVKPSDGVIPIGLHLLSQQKNGKSDGMPHKVVKLPFHAKAKAPDLGRRRSRDLRSLADYRYYNDRVQLEKLEDKGLRYEQIAPAKPIQFGRPRPKAPFAAKSRKPGKAGSLKRRKIAVHLLEEAGVRRSRTPITFGLPLPQGGIYDLRQLCLLSPKGMRVPAQFTATAFWPDNSLKWVLVDFVASLPAKGEAAYSMEFGSSVRRAQARTKLRVRESATNITVVTGPIKAVIDKLQFNVFRAISLDKNNDGLFSQDERVAASAADGIRLVDEKGKLFTAAGRKPESVFIEEKGPQKVVVRVAGKYAATGGQTYMDYILRVTFREGSPRVTVQHTHIDTYLKTEFTDITSLTMPLELAGGLTHATVLLPRNDASLAPRRCSLKGEDALKVFQQDDTKFTLSAGNEETKGKKYPGVAFFEGRRSKVGVAIHEMWQRWPKALGANAKELIIGILPKQPGPLYGRDLPHYLQFPLCEGKYRFKWGISFSTRVTFDFSGRIKPEELAADADHPVVAVLPASWYASTRALGRMPAPMAKQFTQWDKYVETGYVGHMARKQQRREYGYFNYGDWYGERGRNWGNNEYDLAHGMFMQFARTGNRDYFRLALAAARHQADTDCVHAYPDPRYVGANHEHSIGHTGTWSQRPKRATWSYKYGGGTWAGNGHTWAQGMMEAWYLSGDARVMEACIGLGEHIAWAFAPSFHRLGTHERSAGWSLTAIMAIYNGTLDPLYLKAAKRIAEVPLREQKFNEGGAWPHKLPLGHSRQHPGARGNNVFLIGILLAGLMDLHEVTQDSALEKSIISGARWVAKCFNDQEESWPYSATPEGKPLYARCTVGVNTLVVQGVAYAGKLTGEERFIHIAETALGRSALSYASSFGKSFAQKMVFAPATLSLLQEWYAAHRPDKGVSVLDGSPRATERFVARTRDARDHSVRAPNEKIFHVRAIGAGAELAAKRRPHGAMRKGWEFGAITVRDSSGKVVKQGKFSTDLAHEFRAKLKAAGRGAVYRVTVKDDQRGVWSLSGEGLKTVMETVRGFRIGGVGREKLYFFVPRETRAFSVKLLGVHQGAYGGAVLTPANKMAAHHQGSNMRRAFIKGAPKGVKMTGHPERGELRVEPAAGDTGKVWSLVLWAAGDIGCELRGVPPYLAISRDALFIPRNGTIPAK